MKKVILCFLLIGILLIVTGCKNNDVVTDWSKLQTTKYGMIIMPDGSIIKGQCTHFLRYSDDWCYVKIDNVNYYAHQWRITLWEK